VSELPVHLLSIAERACRNLYSSPSDLQVIILSGQSGSGKVSVLHSMPYMLRVGELFKASQIPVLGGWSIYNVNNTVL
jgi:myosin heavy subunit